MDHILMKDDRASTSCVESNSDLIVTKESSKDDHILARVISKNKFHAGEQLSQDENCCQENFAADKVPVIPIIINGHSSLEEAVGSNSSLVKNVNKPCFNENNNHVCDKSNLRCTEEKSCCYYMKFPIKVNNNIYPDKSSKNDGMDDYFQQYSSVPNTSNICSDASRGNAGASAAAISSRLSDKHYYSSNGDCRTQSYPDQINALNGEEEDEDNGCIYTYKGDNYEANLSHLLETCFSCGLPTSERSVPQHGAVSIQRILNGSPHPNPVSNLYSPDMDFLEMDFDPGSTGDGGDSDCEDNSVLNVDLNIDEENSLEKFSRLDPTIEKKSNNIPNEMKSLMCRRCEMCIYNEQKVNNTSSNFTQKLSTNSSILKNGVTEEKFNLPSISSVSNGFTNMQPQLFVNDKMESPSKHFENNLNADDRDFDEEFSDGEEADDEGGDDSTSELPPSDASLEARGVSSSSLFLPSAEFPNSKGASACNNFTQKPLTSPRKTNKQLRFSSETCYSKLSHEFDRENKLYSSDENRAPLNKENLLESDEVDNTGKCCYGSVNGDEVNSENNNLGSVSAPEVSPSKEFSPLEKFSRSISFHNQLSSPKYENVCFSHPYKDNFSSNVNKCQVTGNANEFCNCKHGNSFCNNFQNSETSNLEACVDRLSQREKSVFNITLNSSSSPQLTKSPSKSSCHPGMMVASSAVAAHGNSLLGQSHETLSISNSGIFGNAENEEDNHNCQSPNSRLTLLPIKVLHHKSNDPSIDPNTASEGDMEADVIGGQSKDFAIEKVMIWTERQATVRQVQQVGTSACGPTAIINVLLALENSRPVKTVTSVIKTRLRAENGSLVEYLLSRSNAGTTHEDLLSGVQSISEGAITGRFFHMFPKRAIQLSRWLSHWVKKGGAPVATLNLQVGVPANQTIPDAWHHQMVFGVGEQGIYLTNPLECVSDSLLSDQLCSDSVLLVRRADVESRWDQTDKIINLSLQSDPRWNDMNVLGQVVCVLKEQAAPEMLQGRRHLTTHVQIPAYYKSGVTIFIRSDNPCKTELLEEPELPLLDE